MSSGQKNELVCVSMKGSRVGIQAPGPMLAMLPLLTSMNWWQARPI